MTFFGTGQHSSSSASFVDQQMLQYYPSMSNTVKMEDDVASGSAFPELLPSTSSGINTTLHKLCRICGDVAKSYHFGGLSCDSCKTFFRRSVHCDHYLDFQCYHGGGCVITMGNRKSCQYCRMAKCLSIGMEKSWVMTEDERKALMKARLEKRISKELASLANNTTTGKSFNDSSSTEDCGLSYEAQIERMTDFMSPLEIKEIESIVTKYMHAYKHVPYRSELRFFDNDRPGGQTIEMFGTLVRRFAFYGRLIPDFACLPFQDQSNLLKHGVLEMCVLRGALVYDPVNNRWPNTNNWPIYKDAPVLRLDNIGHLTSSRAFQMHLEFIQCIQQMGVDEPIIMLVILIVLFTPDREGLAYIRYIEKCQAYYTYLLERYMTWRFGPQRSTFMFAKLLTKLSDLRELSDTHNKQDVQLVGNGEISSVHHHVKPDPVCSNYAISGNSSMCVPETPATAYEGQQQSQSRFYGETFLHRQPHQSNTPSYYAQNASAVYATEETSSAIVSVHGSVGDGQRSDMAVQFAHYMQQSIAQVVNAPHFGFEMAQPNYQLEQVQNRCQEAFNPLNTTESSQMMTSIHPYGDSLLPNDPIYSTYNEAVSSSLPTVETEPHSALVTSQTLAELYEELESLEAEYPQQFHGQQNSY